MDLFFAVPSHVAVRQLQFNKLHNSRVTVWNPEHQFITEPATAEAVSHSSPTLLHKLNSINVPPYVFYGYILN